MWADLKNIEWYFYLDHCDFVDLEVFGPLDWFQWDHDAFQQMNANITILAPEYLWRIPLMVPCPQCKSSQSVNMKSPAYSHCPAEFVCYSCDIYGFRFTDDSEDAREFSDYSKALSRANAEAFFKPTTTLEEAKKE